MQFEASTVRWLAVGSAMRTDALEQSKIPQACATAFIEHDIAGQRRGQKPRALAELQEQPSEHDFLFELLQEFDRRRGLGRDRVEQVQVLVVPETLEADRIQENGADDALAFDQRGGQGGLDVHLLDRVDVHDARVGGARPRRGWPRGGSRFSASIVLESLVDPCFLLFSLIRSSRTWSWPRESCRRRKTRSALNVVTRWLSAGP